MGEASEAGDDVEVLAGPVDVVGELLAPGGVAAQGVLHGDRDAALLGLEILGVAERHGREHVLVHVALREAPERVPLGRDAEREVVGGERLRRAGGVSHRRRDDSHNITRFQALETS